MIAGSTPEGPEVDSEPNPLLDSVAGFGPASMRKSYYPELRRRLQELEHFRTLFDAGNDLILLADLANGLIVDVNLPACRHLGWPRNELLGRRVAEVLDGGDLNALLNGQGDRAAAQLETYLRRRDGSRFPVEVTCRAATVVVSRQGMKTRAEQRSALIVARDITDRRSFERALREAKEQAERANLAKTRFLDAASHDLRQPAQSLALLTALLGQELQGHPAAAIIEHLQASVDALAVLLDGILDVSRLDAGLVAAAPEVFSVQALLAPLSGEYGYRAREKGLRFAVVPSSLSVISDPALLARILRNLVENAVRYTPSGGVVVGCRRLGDVVEINVCDTGIGVASEELENVFEEFVQLGNPARDRRQGLGLGLAVVRRLSDLLGHEVKVRSTPGRGSCFSVSVPLAEAGLAGDLPRHERLV